MNYIYLHKNKQLMTKMHRASLLSVLLVLVFCQCSRPEATQLEEALSRLDGTFSRQEEIEQEKEARIREIRSRLDRAEAPAERYRQADLLFEEYKKYDVDSALRYAHLKDRLARKTGDRALLNDAALDLARRYLLSGMYQNALEQIERVDTLIASGAGQLPAYHQNQYEIWHGMALTTKDSLLREDHTKREKYFQRRSQAVQTKKDIDYYTLNADILLEEGKPEQARQLLDKRLENNDLSLLDRSILHYWVAKTHAREGDRDKALVEYAVSADYDLRIPTKEFRSPVKVAQILFENGDIGRAYRYIMRAYRDALQADARICLEEIAGSLPIISAAYEKNEQMQKRRLIFLLGGMALLLATLAAILVLLNRNIRKLDRANLEIQDSQKEIQTINADLEANIARLKEANSIKDSYLGRYLSMFSDHINSLEKYRSLLRVTAKTMDLQEIQQALKSDEFISSERRHLYEEFDSTFLGLFPNFVEQLNALLQPDMRIGRGLPAGTLSNELRVFALIRLGVTESAKIALFLKKSPSTVYNYRVKLRNAALAGYDNFEAELMQIGNPEEKRKD